MHKNVTRVRLEPESLTQVPISGVDYRRLNSKTKRDAFPLPRIDESMAALGEAQIFSTIDLVSSYHQVAVHEKDRP